MLVNVWECKYSFGKTIYYKIRYATGLLQRCLSTTFARDQFLFVIDMRFLQAHNRTAACPLLGLSQIKVNHDASWKTCSDMYLRTNFVQIFNLTFNTYTRQNLNKA